MSCVKQLLMFVFSLGANFTKQRCIMILKIINSGHIRETATCEEKHKAKYIQDNVTNHKRLYHVFISLQNRVEEPLLVPYQQ